MTPITDDFFRSRLDQMIDLRRPLPVLASRLPWQEIEASIAHLFAKKVRAGQTLEDVDLPSSSVHGASMLISLGFILKRAPTRG